MDLPCATEAASCSAAGPGAADILDACASRLVFALCTPAFQADPWALAASLMGVDLSNAGDYSEFTECIKESGTSVVDHVTAYLTNMRVVEIENWSKERAPPQSCVAQRSADAVARVAAAARQLLQAVAHARSVVKPKKPRRKKAKGGVVSATGKAGARAGSLHADADDEDDDDDGELDSGADDIGADDDIEQQAVQVASIHLCMRRPTMPEAFSSDGSPRSGASSVGDIAAEAVACSDLSRAQAPPHVGVMTVCTCPSGDSDAVATPFCLDASSDATAGTEVAIAAEAIPAVAMPCNPYKAHRAAVATPAVAIDSVDGDASEDDDADAEVCSYIGSSLAGGSSSRSWMEGMTAQEEQLLLLYALQGRVAAEDTLLRTNNSSATMPPPPALPLGHIPGACESKYAPPAAAAAPEPVPRPPLPPAARKQHAAPISACATTTHHNKNHAAGMTAAEPPLPPGPAPPGNGARLREPRASLAAAASTTAEAAVSPFDTAAATAGAAPPHADKAPLERGRSLLAGHGSLSVTASASEVQAALPGGMALPQRMQSLQQLSPPVQRSAAAASRKKQAPLLQQQARQQHSNGAAAAVPHWQRHQQQQQQQHSWQGNEAAAARIPPPAGLNRDDHRRTTAHRVPAGTMYGSGAVAAAGQAFGPAGSSGPSCYSWDDGSSGSSGSGPHLWVQRQQHEQQQQHAAGMAMADDGSLVLLLQPQADAGCGEQAGLQAGTPAAGSEAPAPAPPSQRELAEAAAKAMAAVHARDFLHPDTSRGHQLSAFPGQGQGMAAAPTAVGLLAHQQASSQQQLLLESLRQLVQQQQQQLLMLSEEQVNHGSYSLAPPQQQQTHHSASLHGATAGEVWPYCHLQHDQSAADVWSYVRQQPQSAVAPARLTDVAMCQHPGMAPADRDYLCSFMSLPQSWN